MVGLTHCQHNDDINALLQCSLTFYPYHRFEQYLYLEASVDLSTSRFVALVAIAEGEAWSAASSHRFATIRNASRSHPIREVTCHPPGCFEHPMGIQGQRLSRKHQMGGIRPFIDSVN